jgi:hypothetical protein
MEVAAEAAIAAGQIQIAREALEIAHAHYFIFSRDPDIARIRAAIARLEEGQPQGRP